MRLLETSPVARLYKTHPKTAELLRLGETLAHEVRAAIAPHRGDADAVYWAGMLAMERRAECYSILDWSGSAFAFRIRLRNCEQTATVEVDLDK